MVTAVAVRTWILVAAAGLALAAAVYDVLVEGSIAHEFEVWDATR